jgi:tetratricopeptide (TPR) repeat protein
MTMAKQTSLELAGRVASCVTSIVALCLTSPCSAAGAPPRQQCHGPAPLEAAVRDHPSARSWGALAGWFGEQSRFSCAVPAFRNALRFDANSASLHYLLGLSLKSEGNTVEALNELRRSIDIDGSQVEPRLIEGIILNETGRRAEAEEVWETALRIDPTSVTALDWLVKARIADGQFEAAIDLLGTAPPDEALTLDLALAYSQAGQFDKAADTLNQAWKRDPGDLRLASALATVYVQSHRYQDASEAMRTALESHPGNEAAEILYLQLLVMQGDQSNARPLARKLLAAHPKEFDPLYLSGVLEVNAQQYDAAAGHLHDAVALNPSHYDTRYNLGLALAHLGQNEAAREQFKKAVELDPSQAQAHFHLAQVLRALGRADEAQAELELYQARQQATLQLALGQSKAGQAAQAIKDGHASQAVALYREAVAAQPENASYEYDLAVALGAAGDHDAERAALAKAVGINPRFVQAENLLGSLEARDGEAALAEQHFRTALDAAPRYADAANNLGTVLGMQGRDNEAEVWFRSAVSANPRLLQAWVNLAATLAGQSRFDEAQSAVDHALKLDPQNADAQRLKDSLSRESHGTAALPVPGARQNPR